MQKGPGKWIVAVAIGFVVLGLFFLMR